MSHTIRRAASADTDTLVRIIRQSFADVAVRFRLTRENCPKHPSFCRADWIDHASKNGAVFYLLVADGEPVGCAAIEQADSGRCFLERLAVLPGQRRKGFGAALVRHILARARKMGAGRVSAGIIADHAELRQWYQRLGFEETRRAAFPHLPFEVAYMEKSLEPFSRQPVATGEPEG